MHEIEFSFPGSVDIPELGKASPDGTLLIGISKGCYTIDLHKNKLSALPLRVRHILRNRLPKVAHCASCERPPTAALRRCRCGVTKIKLPPEDLSRIERLINRRNRHNRDWLEAQLPGHHTKADLNEILKIQDGRCYFCNWKLIWADGRRFLHADHLIPVTDPRSANWPSNIVLTCDICNQCKGNLSADQFWRRLARTRSRSAKQVRAQKVRAQQFDRQRRSLDKIRKKAVGAACTNLENKIRAMLIDQMRGGLACGVKFQRNAVGVHVGLITMRLPASFHSRVAGWPETRRRAFCQQIVAISNVAGGLAISPY